MTVVCPGGMVTNIYNAERNRPADLSVAARELDDLTLRGLTDWMATVSGADMSAADAADIVVRGSRTTPSMSPPTAWWAACGHGPIVCWATSNDLGHAQMLAQRQAPAPPSTCNVRPVM